MLLLRSIHCFHQRARLSSLSSVSRRCCGRLFSSWSIDPFSGIVSSSSSSSSLPRHNVNDDDEDNDEAIQEQGQFQSILGVEIHAQLDISTKLFSSAPITASASSSSSSLSSSPNTAVHPYDAAVPGFLPSLSVEAVQAAVVAAHLLNCTIPTVSRFERKHYAYADLPHSYQITQQRWPLAVNGNVQCAYTMAAAAASNKSKNKNKMAKQKQQHQTLSCRINRIQLEQDSGKTVQVVNKGSSSGFRESRVDLNRAGQALVEIVSEPDLRTPHEAMALVEHVRQLFKHVGICNGRMEEGSLRCDLNVNLENRATGDRSARVEVKNLNSLRQIIDAATYELHRHAQEWPTVEETRTWNVVASQTELIRRKDQAEDYRFMPEPDLPPLVLDNSTDSNYNVFDGLGMEEFLARRIPELPAQALERMVQEYGLTEYQARVITGDPPAIPFLDTAIATAKANLDFKSQKQENRAVEMSTNFLINDLFGLVKEHSQVEAEASISESNVSPEQLGEVMAMILNGNISTTMAKNLLLLLYTKERGKRPAEVAAAQGWQLVTDPTELRRLCEQVLEAHPDEVVTYRKGGKYEIKIFKFLTGKAMAASKGTAEPERLKDMLQTALEEHRETKGV